MFTGIIESIGKIVSTTNSGSNKSFRIESDISHQLKVDESVNHDGVCLTVEETAGSMHTVTAIKETLDKTNLAGWKEGDLINLERAMLMTGRIDGHIVQGHVDSTAKCVSRKDYKGSSEFTFKFRSRFATLMIEKGSVCVNGISLTAFQVKKNKFTVAIIPYTFEHTNMPMVQPDAVVNIEFDIFGKYIARIMNVNGRK